MRLARFVFIPSIKIITTQTQSKTFTIEKLIKSVLKKQIMGGSMIQLKNDVVEVPEKKKPNKFRNLFMYLAFSDCLMTLPRW